MQLLDDAVKDSTIGLEKTPKDGEVAIIRIRQFLTPACASCEWRGESNRGHMTGEKLGFYHVRRSLVASNATTGSNKPRLR